MIAFLKSLVQRPPLSHCHLFIGDGDLCQMPLGDTTCDQPKDSSIHLIYK